MLSGRDADIIQQWLGVANVTGSAARKESATECRWRRRAYGFWW